MHPTAPRERAASLSKEKTQSFPVDD